MKKIKHFGFCVCVWGKNDLSWMIGWRSQWGKMGKKKGVGLGIGTTVAAVEKLKRGIWENKLAAYFFVQLWKGIKKTKLNFFDN